MHSGKFTKIVATIGPASDSEESLRKLILAGVNVFRFNMKHNVPDWHLERINLVQKIADELKIQIGIMIDLQGPEIRIELVDEKPLELVDGDFVYLTDSFENIPEEKDVNIIRLAHSVVVETLDVDDRFSIDDGFFQFKVIEKVNKTLVKAEILNEGKIGHRKSMNLVGKDVELPSLIEEDLDKLDMATKTKVDFVALSFVRTKKDLEILRKELEERKLDAKIVAKVESQKALDNIEDIIKYSDVVMIARGDLGIETPIERLPFVQKRLINMCRDENTPVIVATQMLQSMITNPLPTRAEAADVANAAFDMTDAVMLSGETATGKYPVRAVEHMARIVKFNEDKAVSSFIPKADDQTHALVRGGLEILKPNSGIKIDKVVIFTESGNTARIFSSYRPLVPVIAVSNNRKTIETLTLSFGIIPHYIKIDKEENDDPAYIIDSLEEFGYLSKGEKVLMLHGKRLMDPNNTNSLVVIEV